MTARTRRDVAVLTACCAVAGSPLAAQTTGTLDVSASFVEYDGFLPSGAAVLSASVRHDGRSVTAGGAAGWTIFESGNQILQATAAAAWLNSPRSDAWRLELAGSVGASRYAAEPVSGHMLARARVHVLGDDTGASLGVSTGATVGDSARIPVEIAAAAWSLRDDVALVATMSAARLARYRQLDLLGTARWTLDPVEIEARVGARPWAQGGIAASESFTGLYGDLSLLVTFRQRFSVAVSGGSYPSDPIRGLLAARYINAGLRVRFGPDAAAMTPVAIVAPPAVGADGDAEAAARLEAVREGELHRIRVRAPGAQHVELMADFTDWQPQALTRGEQGVWELLLPLAPGVHRVNVRIDGGPWLVPAGTRAEESEFGGRVGVLIVR